MSKYIEIVCFFTYNEKKDKSSQKGGQGMKTLKIADGIHMLTMNVEDILFEGIWEIGNGVTLNSYIVQGKRRP